MFNRFERNEKKLAHDAVSAFGSANHESSKEAIRGEKEERVWKAKEEQRTEAERGEKLRGLVK